MVLRRMRAGAQGMAAKVLMALIVFVLAVTGFGAIQLFSGSEPIAATVNGEDITERELAAEVDSRRRAYQNSSEDLSEQALDNLVNRADILGMMINNKLLAQAAADLDLSMSDEVVRERLRRELAGEGIDEAEFLRVLASSGRTPTSFHDERRASEVIGQLVQGVRETAFLTARELRRDSQVAAQGRDIAWLTFSVAELMQEVDVTDDDIEDHYNDYRDQYVTKERFDFDIVRLPRAALEADVEISEDAVETAYQAEVANAEPLRHAAHILLEVTAERSADEAKRQLAETRAAIAAGGDFAELARELSEDPGSAEAGGDLGPTARGVFPAPFEDALWALAPGELSEPVETEFGVHLVRLIRIEEPDIPALDAMRAELVSRLRIEEAALAFERVLREMDEIAFESEDSLDDLASHFDLAVEPVNGITRDSRAGLLADDALRTALFAGEVLEGFNSRAVATDAEAVVGRLRDRHPPVRQPLDEVRESVRLSLAEFEARANAEERVLNALQRLGTGATPAEVADSFGLDWQRADDFRHEDPEVPREVADLAFQIPAPPPGERASEVARLADGSRALVLLSGVNLVDYEALPESDRGEMAGLLRKVAADRDFVAVLETLRADAAIEAVGLRADRAATPAG